MLLIQLTHRGFSIIQSITTFTFLMPIFNNFLTAAGDVNTLTNYIGNHLSELSAFSKTPIERQKTEHDDYYNFVLSKANILSKLDYSISYNRAFIYYLLDFSEIAQEESVFVILYSIIKDNDLKIGSRLKAVLLYLHNIPSNQVLVDRFDRICQLIEISINEEEDTDKKAIVTFLHYYSYVVRNTNNFIVDALQTKYHQKKDSIFFLQKPAITQCLQIDYFNLNEFNTFIQTTIDNLLGHGGTLPILSIPSCPNFLIEEGTDYASSLFFCHKSFDEIRNISVQKLKTIADADDIFNSLGRGVKILHAENQLFCYLKSFGKMHKAKLESALEKIPTSELQYQNIEIIDWACGQGLASIVLLEYIQKHHISLNIEKVVLIEPSDIALKRAALHVKHFNSTCQLQTILKDNDSITNEDIGFDNNATRIFLFSNILDVDDFSMEHLLSLLKQINGTAYFICVSPYINDAKTARIDSFVRFFKQTYNSYTSKANIDETKGEWINSWSRVIRVFKIN